MAGFRVGWLLAWALLMGYFTLFLIYPVLYVFARAFTVDGKLSVAYFTIMMGDPVLTECIWNSFLIASATTLLTLLAGYAMAYLMAYYNFKFKEFFQAALLIPFIVPPFVGAIGMIKLFSRFGSVNIFLTQLVGILGLGRGAVLIDWFGNKLLGIIFLEVLHLYPIAYLNIVAALSNIDPTLEETAETLGVKGLRKFLTVILPLSLPGVAAAAAIVFIWSFTDLGTPLMFNYFKVVPVQIFTMSREIYANPMGYALTVFVIGVTSLIFLGIRRYVSLRSYEMMGRGHVSLKARRLGKKAAALTAVLLSAWILIAALPHISILLMSVSDKWFLTVLPSSYTLAHFQEVLTNKLTATSLRNSMFYSVAATLMATLVGVATAYVSSRGSLPSLLKDLLDVIAMWPLIIPGIALAFGYLSTFADNPLLSAYRDPTLLLILAYTTRRLPYMVRAVYAGLQQVHRNLEEAAMTLGAKPVKVLKDVTLPLTAANVSAGAVLVFSESMIEVSTSLMLALRQQYYPVTKAIYEISTRLAVGNELASALGVILMAVVAASMSISSKVMGERLGELFKT